MSTEFRGISPSEEEFIKDKLNQFVAASEICKRHSHAVNYVRGFRLITAFSKEQRYVPV